MDNNGEITANQRFNNKNQDPNYEHVCSPNGSILHLLYILIPMKWVQTHLPSPLPKGKKN